MKRKEKPEYSMAQCLGYMFRLSWRKQKIVVIMVLLLGLIQFGLNLTQLYAAPVILEKVENFAPIGELLGSIALFAGLLFVLTAGMDYCDKCLDFPKVGLRLGIVIDAVNHCMQTSYPLLSDPKVKELMGGVLKSTSGDFTATGLIWKELHVLIASLLSFAVYLALLANLNGWIILLLVVTAGINFAVNLRLNDWDYRHRDEENELWNQFSYLQNKSESVNIAKDIRIFGIGPWLTGIYHRLLGLHSAWCRGSATAQFWVALLDVAMTLIRSIVAYGYLIHLAISQNLSAPEFILYFGAITGFSAWVMGILEGFSKVQKHCRDISGCMEYLNYPELFRFEGGRPIPQADAYEIRLENVTFRYPGAESNLFENLNLTLHAGEKLAMVGLNGAGKTTLVKLLCGFYDPDGGRVTLNGVDIREFNRQDYYALFSGVFQDYSVIDVTVAQNVSGEFTNFDLSRVEACLDQAGLLEFARSLPKGLDTTVGREIDMDGVQFSGGQTQRLLLARALYKDSPLLVLDEPTAALDAIAEDDIYQKYNSMTAGKSALFISHRLASTRFCDRIIFVADGRAAEEGTHASLMAQGGQYAALFEVQSRYYQEGSDFRGE